MPLSSPRSLNCSHISAKGESHALVTVHFISDRLLFVSSLVRSAFRQSLHICFSVIFPRDFLRFWRVYRLILALLYVSLHTRLSNSLFVAYRASTREVFHSSVQASRGTRFYTQHKTEFHQEYRFSYLRCKPARLFSACRLSNRASFLHSGFVCFLLRNKT